MIEVYSDSIAKYMIRISFYRYISKLHSNKTSSSQLLVNMYYIFAKLYIYIFTSTFKGVQLNPEGW